MSPTMTTPEKVKNKKRRFSYDVTAAMDRLRSSMVGDGPVSPCRRSTEVVVDSSAVLNEETPLHLSFGDDSNHLFSSQRAPDISLSTRLRHALGQAPAIILIGLFHLMIGIPFGVSYFPVGWRATAQSTSSSEDDDEGVDGPFPLPAKEALGIRMFLFSTIIGQVVFTLFSGFENPIGLQMVENVPFCHELAAIAIRHQGYGVNALSTLFVMFGMASVVVGVVFYTLGRLNLGKVVHYFPSHVLVGCIGGIGLFIAKTGLEVTIDDVFSIGNVIQYWNLLAAVLFFEVGLRLLERIFRDAEGKQLYSLLSPIYFCLITPFFYAALWILGVSTQTAMDAGFFFPPLDACDESVQDCSDEAATSSFWDSIFNEHLFDIWRVPNLTTVSFPAIVDSLPVLLALVLFSLIHVPINIPAFAVTKNVETDMNRELMAHGYSNCLAGIFGGLQNYMAYTQSVLYDKSGGTGKASGIAVAVLTSMLFFVGPAIASYIPRCMAGTLLFHVGIDLFLEGVYDSYGKFDSLEYAGIWLITSVMTLYGMEAAMIAGVISAVTTFAVQNISYVDPLRGIMPATTLRSSQWNRSTKAQAILADPLLGRSRILVVQLQGHLFFGNMANLTDAMTRLLSERLDTVDAPLIVIMDFSLVLGVDSSAAQAIAKLKNVMQNQYGIELCIFVTGSRDGFPTEYPLSEELAACDGPDMKRGDDSDGPNETTGLLNPPQVSSQSADPMTYIGCHVCSSLDLALIHAENALLAKQSSTLLNADIEGSLRLPRVDSRHFSEERETALAYLTKVCPPGSDRRDVETLCDSFTRESYAEGVFVWKQGSASDCFKLLVRGRLIALLENEAGTSETIATGQTIGELGLLEGIPRMSSVKTLSDDVVLYSLSREDFVALTRKSPRAARLVDLICIRYLSARVQHVSNRIFETRCLPV